MKLEIGDYFFYQHVQADEWVVGKIMGKSPRTITERGYRFHIVAMHIRDYRSYDFDEQGTTGDVQIDSFMWRHMGKIDDKREVIRAII